MNNQLIIPGQTIITLRRRKAWSRDRLAYEAGIRPQTLRYIEKNRTVPRHQTIEKIAKALKTTPEQMLYHAREEPHDEETRTNQKANDYGIIKCTASPIDRVPDYKRVFLEASGDVFVSGTSMISLSEDSAYLLETKLRQGAQIRALILDPIWIKKHYSLLTFLPDEAARKRFHFEITNSISKLRAVYDGLPAAYRRQYTLKTYRTVFPYIVTGYLDATGGRCVVEITDYLPERERPRFTLAANKRDTLFELIRKKFDSLWNSDLVETVF